MPRFEFHPEAARGLDERGNALLSRVVRTTPERGRPSFASQRVPAQVITEEQIVGRILSQSIDELKGEVTAVSFEGSAPGGLFGLEGEAVRELDKLAQLAQKYLHAHTSISLRFLRDALIDWLQKSFRKEINEPLSEFIQSRIAKEVVPRTILIPIANLCLEEDLPFGPILFKVINPEMVDSWYAAFRASCRPDNLASLDERLDRIRKETQGRAAASLTLEADEFFARDQCLEKAEQAVALLRVIHPFNTSPHTILYVRPLGSENVESYNAYGYKSGEFEGRRVEARWSYPSFWEIPKEEYQGRLIQNLISLFATKQRTDFQQRLFDALLIYSRNNIAKEPSEKLIFCLVAVESMLLKNSSEPIQDNIGERMAYILGRTAQERLEIESLVKHVYAVRSKFIHHGQRPTDMDVLARFMHKAWLLFFHFTLNHQKIQTKDEMIEELRQLKYR
jgi:hypothetical protein